MPSKHDLDTEERTDGDRRIADDPGARRLFRHAAAAAGAGPPVVQEGETAAEARRGAGGPEPVCRRRAERASSGREPARDY